MNDTHETNLPVEETGKLEETKAPEVTPENTAAEVEVTETVEEATAECGRLNYQKKKFWKSWPNW